MDLHHGFARADGNRMVLHDATAPDEALTIAGMTAVFLDGIGKHAPPSIAQREYNPIRFLRVAQILSVATSGICAPRHRNFAIERCDRYAEPFGDAFRRAFRDCEEGTCFAFCSFVEFPLRAAGPALRARRGEAGGCPLADDAAFKLGERAADMKQQPSARRRFLTSALARLAGINLSAIDAAIAHALTAGLVQSIPCQRRRSGGRG